MTEKIFKILLLLQKWPNLSETFLNPKTLWCQQLPKVVFGISRTRLTCRPCASSTPPPKTTPNLLKYKNWLWMGVWLFYFSQYKFIINTWDNNIVSTLKISHFTTFSNIAIFSKIHKIKTRQKNNTFSGGSKKEI